MRWNRVVRRWGVWGVMAMCGCSTTSSTGYETSSTPVVEPRPVEDDGEREPAPMVGEDPEPEGERRGTRIDLGLGGAEESSAEEVHIESSETLLEKQERAEDLQAERERCEALFEERCAGKALACIEKIDASCFTTLSKDDDEQAEGDDEPESNGTETRGSRRAP